MKNTIRIRAAIFALALTMGGVIGHLAYGQDKAGKGGEVRETTAKDKAAMDRQNREFMQKESERPAADKDYRQTKEYKNQSPEQQRETDRQIEQMNRALEKVREQQAREANPAERPAPNPSPTPQAAHKGGGGRG